MKKISDTSSFPTGWSECVWREVQFPANLDHYWCRDWGNNVDIAVEEPEDEDDRNDTYSGIDYSSYIYKHGNGYSSNLGNEEFQNLTVGELRGKIFIIKDFTDDENHTDKGKRDPNSCTGNQFPTTNSTNHCTEYAPIPWDTSGYSIQDIFNDIEDGLGPITGKKQYVSEHFDNAATRSNNKVFVNHLSANYAPSGAFPNEVAMILNPYGYNEMANREYVGFVIMDFPGQALIQRIIQQNVSFSTVDWTLVNFHYVDVSVGADGDVWAIRDDDTIVRRKSDDTGWSSVFWTFSTARCRR